MILKTTIEEERREFGITCYHQDGASSLALFFENFVGPHLLPQLEVHFVKEELIKAIRSFVLVREILFHRMIFCIIQKIVFG